MPHFCALSGFHQNAYQLVSHSVAGGPQQVFHILVPTVFRSFIHEYANAHRPVRNDARKAGRPWLHKVLV